VTEEGAETDGEDATAAIVRATETYSITSCGQGLEPEVGMTVGAFPVFKVQEAMLGHPTGHGLRIGKVRSGIV
jgi:hypothetical protein